MSWKLNVQDENPLYRNYLDNFNNEERWMKEIHLNTTTPSKSYSSYSEEEFLEKIKSDSYFSDKWGVK